MLCKHLIFTICIKLMIALEITGSLATNRVFGQEPGYMSQSLFIYQFTKYITWPDEYTQTDLIIGVYGKSPILDELKIMASLKKAPNGNPIIIRSITSIEEMQTIHILYIPSAKSREINAINLQLSDKPTLTVAERDGMAKKGAIISFIILETGILKFEINKTALEKKKLIIAPDLLKLGFIVG